MAASVGPSTALLLSAATCAAVLAAVVPSFAQSSPQDFLDLHNAARAVVGVAPLSWDGTLAAYAQSYANQRRADCKLLHSGGPYGENMFWGSAGAGWNAADAVISWVSEKEDYDCCSNTCAAGKVCGHYTQVVWADSTRLGCANVTCGGGSGTLMLCEYKPVGNIVGQRPFTGCAQFDGSGKGNCSVPNGSVPSGNNSIPHGTAPRRNDSIPFPSGHIPRQNGNSTNRTSDSLSSRNASKRRPMLPIVLPVVIALCLISAIITCVWRRRRRTGSRSKNTIQCTSYSENVEDIQAVVLLSPALVGAATDNFAEVNKLGGGGFGQVYKGMLPDGREVAVKRLSKGSKQGVRELKNELVLVAKLQHRNLVKLIGACLHEEEKLLVYEYIPNKSLDAFIFDDEKRKQLTWGTRYKIICGIARGMVCLHDESRVKVIHRDLKPSNILLEKDMTPKISDFGLARVFEGDHTKDITRRVAGTYGYMAPEYALLGHVSTKSDVFSFGVIVLEIVTGRRNTTSEPMMAEHLLSYAWDNWTGGTITEIVDSFLHYNCAESEALKCIHIGLLCVQENPSDRPSMSNVILMLVGRFTTLPAPSRPAFLFRLNDENHFHHGVNNRPEGSNNSNSSYNKVTITELEAR